MKLLMLFLWMMCSQSFGQNNQIPKPFALEPKASVQGSFHQELNSDGWKNTFLNLSGNEPLSDIFWPYQEEPDQFHTWFADVTSERRQQESIFYDSSLFRIHHVTKYSVHSSLDLALGVADLKDSVSLHTVKGSVDLNWKYLSSDFSIHTFATHAPAASWIQGSAAWMTNNVANLVQAQIAGKPWNGWRAQSNLQNIWISDGNSRQKIDLEMKYGVFQQSPWFWIGPGYEHLHFEKRSTDYWSPEWSDSMGLRMEFAANIQQQIQWTLGGSYHALSGSDQSPGVGHYLRTGLTYGNRNESFLALFFEDTLSSHDNTQWNSKIWSLSAQWIFP